MNESPHKKSSTENDRSALAERALRTINELRGVMQWCGFNQNWRLGEAIEVIEAQARALSDGTPPNGWISVKDQMPPRLENVIVPGGIGYWWDDANGWYTITGFNFPGKPIQRTVTHWQPLPAAPEAPNV